VENWGDKRVPMEVGKKGEDALPPLDILQRRANALSPVHTDDYSRRSPSPNSATVAVFSNSRRQIVAFSGDKLWPFPATIVASVDRALSANSITSVCCGFAMSSDL